MRIHMATVAAALLLLSAPADAAEVWTGCKDLATGALSKAKVGTKPASACNVARQVQVTYTKPFTPRKGPVKVTREWNAFLDTNEDELRIGPGLAILCTEDAGFFTVTVIINGKTEYEQASDNGIDRIFTFRRPNSFKSQDIGQGYLVSADGSVSVWSAAEPGGCWTYGTADFMVR